MPEKPTVKVSLRTTKELHSTEELPPPPDLIQRATPPAGVPRWGKGLLGIATLAGIIAIGSYLMDGGQSQPPMAGTEGGFLEALPQPPPLAALNDGPFRYSFEENGTLRYGLNAQVQGLGSDSIETSGIGLDIAFDFTLTTESISTFGNARLRLDFGTVQMSGTFMGSPINLYHSPERTQMQLDARTTLDTDRGDRIDGIPQIEFFRDPIYITVTPEGRVTQVEGRPQFDEMLASANVVSPVEFELSAMEPGQTWNSEFKLPVPGLGAPAPAKILNTFVGYEPCGTNQCGVIDQRFLSQESNGNIISPSSIFGEQMGFSMPKFEVTGQNRVWFDTEDQNLSRADLDLRFELALGQEFDPAKELIQTYGKLLNELEGNTAKGGDDGGKLLDMGVDIKASLGRIE